MISWLFLLHHHEVDIFPKRFCEMSLQLLDGLSWNLVQTFMFPSCWIVITLFSIVETSNTPKWQLEQRETSFFVLLFLLLNSLHLIVDQSRSLLNKETSATLTARFLFFWCASLVRSLLQTGCYWGSIQIVLTVESLNTSTLFGLFEIGGSVDYGAITLVRLK